ncbi:MAG: dihydrodipicolinate synthase family protein [Candidatus Poribacteria bacterium]|nr:dihydrodipicolinate synthase family protein [Candidatus Poribacteria bacterium]
MPLALPHLLDALNSVTAIPIIPFKNGKIDYVGHAKNIDYLMTNNYLDEGRKRVIAIAGTSLIHHIAETQQLRLIEKTGQQMGDDGILISGIVPNPIRQAGQLIEAQSELNKPPDAYLLMPLTGVSNPEGIYEEYMKLGEHYGSKCDARFLYYFRQKRDLEAVIRLLNDSPHFIGVKIGTDENDVQPLIEGVGDSGIVMWGIGDRCTRPAQLGTKGHTSGIAVAYARASDEINNAQRRGDYETSARIEADIAPLEEIRFMNERVYNYSAVVEAMILSGFDDVEAGAGGPFNPRVPPEIHKQLRGVTQDLKRYH